MRSWTKLTRLADVRTEFRSCLAGLPWEQGRDERRRGADAVPRAARAPAIVVTDLASLRGPAAGTVELPLRLFWSSPDRTFDLDKPFMRLYQTVLREASRPEDLIRDLDRQTLISLWPGLHLPRGVRQAWEEHHPVLGLRRRRLDARHGAAPPGRVDRLARSSRARVRARLSSAEQHDDAQ